MHKKFNHQAIEQKWQAKWKEEGLYDVPERDESKEKKFILVEFPYPSGNLHIGHWFAFAVVDIYARFSRMQGKQVFFPIGFDSFGLPAENAAIKRGLDPKEWTYDNIAHMVRQLESMGNSFAWDAHLRTSDPEYYQWTQWMFNKFFENDTVYRGFAEVNWCPSCNTVLANEQVVGNTCERCGTEVVQKRMEQWMMRITKYADRLIDDLEPLAWPEHIKDSQRNWIGRSEGSELTFPLSTGDTVNVFTTRADTLYGATYLVLAPEHPLLAVLKNAITNWSEVEAYQKATAQKKEIERTAEGKEKTGIQLEGITAINPANGKEIPVFIADYVLARYGTGAIMAVPAHDARDFAFAQKYDLPIVQVVVPCDEDSKNPPKPGLTEITRDTIVVYLKNTQTKKYALLNWHESLEGVTTGIMGGIDEGLTAEEAVIKEVEEESGITGIRITKKLPWIMGAKYCASHKNENRCALTSAFLAEVDGLTSQGAVAESEKQLHTLVWVDAEVVLTRLTPDAQKRIWQLLHREEPLTDEGILIGSGTFNGMESRGARKLITEHVGGKLTKTYKLRDWSMSRQRYWGVPIPIVYDPKGKPHPVPREHLPWLLPTDVDFKPTGVAPLAKSKELRERTERIFGTGWTPEVETMDTFIDSSWYYLRYTDPQNTEMFASLSAQKAWMPVDIYFGGAEHTTMHLLYSRFWQKVLFDLGLATVSEPYNVRINRGLVLGPDGNKMSKSKGNVIDPDEQVTRMGADTVKMYLAFMGPYGETSNYPWDMGGIAGLRRFLERVYGLEAHITETETPKMTQQLHETIEKVVHDTELYKFNTAISTLMVFLNVAEKEGLTKESYTTFLRLLAPFAPHITDELWESAGEKGSIHTTAFPVANQAILAQKKVTIAMQINGKTRGTLEIELGSGKEEVLSAIEATPNLVTYRRGVAETTIIFVQNKVINFIGQVK